MIVGVVCPEGHRVQRVKHSGAIHCGGCGRNYRDRDLIPVGKGRGKPRKRQLEGYAKGYRAGHAAGYRAGCDETLAMVKPQLERLGELEAEEDQAELEG